MKYNLMNHNCQLIQICNSFQDTKSNKKYTEFNILIDNKKVI